MIKHFRPPSFLPNDNYLDFLKHRMQTNPNSVLHKRGRIGLVDLVDDYDMAI